MAGSFLMEGKRVLLIDANFRRPMSNRLFPPSGAASTEQQADYGLSNYLMGQCTDENQIIRSTDMQGLFVIDSGPLPSNLRTAQQRTNDPSAGTMQRAI